ALFGRLLRRGALAVYRRRAMPLFLELVERGGRQPIDPQIVDGDVTQDLEEPAGEFAFGVVGLEPLVDAQKALLRQVFGERAIAREAMDEVDRGGGVPRYQFAIRRLRAAKCILGQFSIALRHGHALYGAGTRAVSNPKTQIQISRPMRIWDLELGIWSLGFGVWDFFMVSAV